MRSPRGMHWVSVMASGDSRSTERASPTAAVTCDPRALSTVAVNSLAVAREQHQRVATAHTHDLREVQRRRTRELEDGSRAQGAVNVHALRAHLTVSSGFRRTRYPWAAFISAALSHMLPGMEVDPRSGLDGRAPDCVAEPRCETAGRRGRPDRRPRHQPAPRRVRRPLDSTGCLPTCCPWRPIRILPRSRACGVPRICASAATAASPNMAKFHERAWHAGQSSWEGRAACNDFSIGVELEGADTVPDEPRNIGRLRKSSPRCAGPTPSCRPVAWSATAMSRRAARPIPGPPSTGRMPAP